MLEKNSGNTVKLWGQNTETHKFPGNAKRRSDLDWRLSMMTIELRGEVFSTEWNEKVYVRNSHNLIELSCKFVLTNQVRSYGINNILINIFP